MACWSCAAKVTTALKNIASVEDVKVSAPKNQAVVEYDPAKVTPEKIVEAIKDGLQSGAPGQGLVTRG